MSEEVPEPKKEERKEPAPAPEEAFDEAAWEGVLTPPAEDEDEEEDEEREAKPEAPEAPEPEDEEEDDGEEEGEEPESERLEFLPAKVRVKPGVFSTMQGLDAEVERSREQVRAFTELAAARLGAEVRREDGHLLVNFPREVPRGVRRKRRLVFDLASMRPQATELAAPGSRFLRELTAIVAPRAPVSVARAAVEKPLNVFHYRVSMVALHFRHDDVVAVCVDDLGLREEPPALPDGEGEAAPTAGLPPDLDLELVEGAARKNLMKGVAPKLDELSRAVAAGLETSLRRIRRYYQQVREEARMHEAKLRRRIGELNSRLWFTEDGLRERRMERERDDLQRQLAEIKQGNKQMLEALDEEEAQRLARESGKHKPTVRLELVGVTRVEPP